MGWLGKIIGGTLGFMFGWPLGLIAGAAFGHMFDKAGELGQQGSRQDGQSQRQQGRYYGSGPVAYGMDQTQMLFFVGAFSMLARIAAVDGQVSSAEQKKVEEFIVQDLRLDTQGHAAAMRVFQAAINGGGTFEQFATQFYQNFSREPALLQLMIDIFYRVAVADGEINRAENDLIRTAGKIFHLSDSIMDSISRKYGGASATTRAYAVLGLTPQASDDEIKRAYRKMSIEFHPDTVASKGLPEEFTTYATEKFREIQEAYESIKRERGIK